MPRRRHVKGLSGLPGQHSKKHMAAKPQSDASLHQGLQQWPVATSHTPVPAELRWRQRKAALALIDGVSHFVLRYQAKDIIGINAETITTATGRDHQQRRHGTDMSRACCELPDQHSENQDCT